MDIVEQLRKSANIVYAQDGYTFRLGLQNEAADEIERLQLREETLSGIIDGMTARFIEAQGAVEEIERLREANKRLGEIATDAVGWMPPASVNGPREEYQNEIKELTDDQV